MHCSKVALVPELFSGTRVIQLQALSPSSMRTKITRIEFFAIVFLLSKLSLAVAQSYDEIVKLDPAAVAIISGDEVVEKMGDGFGFLEGPVWVHAISAVQRYPR